MSEIAHKRAIIGEIISDKRDKTVGVKVTRKVKHPLYGKYIIRTTKLHAHDEENKCKMGDMVKIEGSRPISKTKMWKVVDILSKHA